MTRDPLARPARCQSLGSVARAEERSRGPRLPGALTGCEYRLMTALHEVSARGKLVAGLLTATWAGLVVAVVGAVMTRGLSWCSYTPLPGGYKLYRVGIVGAAAGVCLTILMAYRGKSRPLWIGAAVTVVALLGVLAYAHVVRAGWGFQGECP